MTSREIPATSPIDAYLVALSARLTVEPAARATILEEIRGHLEEAATAEAARGATGAEAEARAVAAFGSVGETARSINAVHPVYWDWRRMAQGIVFGALAIWVTWTLITFPFLVQMAVAHRLNPGASDASGMTPGELFFSSSPLSFGLFKVLFGEGPWAVLLVLAIFGAIAFALGSRASQGWRAGLAFGLGVFVGMPYLPLVFVFHDRAVMPQSLLPAIISIWLLIPYSVLAAWLGARVARRMDTRALHRPPATGHLMGSSAFSARKARRLSTTALAGLALLVILLGINGWSLVRAVSIPIPVSPPASQQLANAQQVLPFIIRQPRFLPSGTRLTGADASGEAWCGKQCSVVLQYRNSDGTWLDLLEIPNNPSPPGTGVVGTGMIPTPPASPDGPGALSTITAVGYQPVWWLGGKETSEQQTSLRWDDGALEYFLSTNGRISADTLRQIALSLYQ
ncbi:MAG: permease prefix domain 1-containing protein [Nitrososphaerota archaeon]